MIYALKNGNPCEADVKKSAECPLCNQPVFTISQDDIGFWSHLYQRHCDPWALDETHWSIAWKKLFPPSCVDIPIVKEESHFADILTSSGITMKLCFTLFPTIDIQEVESFFGERMIWIVDAQPFGITVEKGTKEKSVIILPQVFALTKWHGSTRPLFFDINETDLVYFESGTEFQLQTGKIIAKERVLKKYIA